MPLLVLTRRPAAGAARDRRQPDHRTRSAIFGAAVRWSHELGHPRADPARTARGARSSPGPCRRAGRPGGHAGPGAPQRAAARAARGHARPGRRAGVAGRPAGRPGRTPWARAPRPAAARVPHHRDPADPRRRRRPAARRPNWRRRRWSSPAPPAGRWSPSPSARRPRPRACRTARCCSAAPTGWTGTARTACSSSAARRWPGGGRAAAAPRVRRRAGRAAADLAGPAGARPRSAVVVIAASRPAVDGCGDRAWAGEWTRGRAAVARPPRGSWPAPGRPAPRSPVALAGRPARRRDAVRRLVQPGARPRPGRRTGRARRGDAGGGRTGGWPASTAACRPQSASPSPRRRPTYALMGDLTFLHDGRRAASARTSRART